MGADISETGARLDIAAPHDLPENLLLLTSDSKARRKCRVVWRSAHQIGVQFEKRNGARAHPGADTMQT